MILGLVVSLAVVAAFVAAAAAVRRAALPAAVSPVVVTALGIGVLLAASGIPVARFTELTRPLHPVLGPAIVALGAGVHANRRMFAAIGRPLAVAIIVGTLTGIASAAALARGLGLGPLLTAATLTRTASTPFAVLVQSRTGGPVPLAAGLAVATGVIGAVLLPAAFRLCGVRDPVVIGTATGVAAHLVGAEAVGRRDPVAGAFAGAALAGAGVLTALLVPPLWHWLGG